MTGDRGLDEFLERSIQGLDSLWSERVRRFQPAPFVPMEDLRTHPDLGERLEQVVAGLGAVEVGVFFGYNMARNRDGQVFAFAAGMSYIHFSVGKESVTEAVDLGATPDSSVGDNWVKVDAWNSNVRTAAWLEVLAAIAAMAHRNSR